MNSTSLDLAIAPACGIDGSQPELFIDSFESFNTISFLNFGREIRSDYQTRVRFRKVKVFCSCLCNPDAPFFYKQFKILFLQIQAGIASPAMLQSGSI